MDGVFSDAYFVKGVACIACVRICGGAVGLAYTKLIVVESSHAAEVAGIRFAQECFPNTTIFNDSTSACDDTGAEWVPREHNHVAHHAAHVALSRLRNDPNTRRELNWQQREHVQRIHAALMRKPVKRKRRKGGRGVIALGTNRYLSGVS